MATKTLYVCSNCGHQEAKWLGRCPACGEWSTFVEEAREEKKVVGFAERATRKKARAAGRTLRLDQVEVETDGGRIGTSVGELDRVLGGGIVPGSMVLV
nr:DNA repair protein RadA [Actinomycetota bacterium]